MRNLGSGKPWPNPETGSSSSDDVGGAVDPAAAEASGAAASSPATVLQEEVERMVDTVMAIGSVGLVRGMFWDSPWDIIRDILGRVELMLAERGSLVSRNGLILCQVRQLQDSMPPITEGSFTSILGRQLRMCALLDEASSNTDRASDLVRDARLLLSSIAPDAGSRGARGVAYEHLVVSVEERLASLEGTAATAAAATAAAAAATASTSSAAAASTSSGTPAAEGGLTGLMMLAVASTSAAGWGAPRPTQHGEDSADVGGGGDSTSSSTISAVDSAHGRDSRQSQRHSTTPPLSSAASEEGASASEGGAGTPSPLGDYGHDWRQPPTSTTGTSSREGDLSSTVVSTSSSGTSSGSSY
ncbi:hypothetical protein, partial [Candidatus Ichthyocystis sparus]|uniref:hypothetical protein n=1 Tax=Candidatus Ichthyocystis sparus TaxID=1561004 RepID=UPI001F5FA3C4